MGTNSAFSYKAVYLLSIDPSIVSQVLIPLLESSTDQRLRISLTTTICQRANIERYEVKVLNLINNSASELTL